MIRILCGGLLAAVFVLIAQTPPLDAQHGFANYGCVPHNAVIVRKFVAHDGFYPTIRHQTYGHGHYGHHNYGAFSAPAIVFPYPAQLVSPYSYGGVEAYQHRAMLREVVRDELKALIAPPAGSEPLPVRKAEPKKESLTLPKGQSKVADLPPEVRKGLEEAGGPKAWVPDIETPKELQDKVLAIYTGPANCVSCHGGGAKDSGGLKLVLVGPDGKYTLTRQSALMRSKITLDCMIGAMPPAAVSDESKIVDRKLIPDLVRYATQKLGSD